MIDTLVIVIHDRFQNLITWFKILKQCERPKNVVVIHNYSQSVPQYLFLCEENNALYLHRSNTGFDIGAFQDVCTNRLPGFPEWDQLLWCTDDTFPMQKDFLRYFALSEKEGIRCMEISPYVRTHVRTTGFAITKNVAQQLVFPADPVTTKQQCYEFEHRSKNIMLEQVKRMGLTVRMVAPREKSPMFDTGYHRRVRRDKELRNKWNLNPVVIPEVLIVPEIPKVTVICPIYKSFPAIISSMIMQTHKNWELLLIHDGPEEGAVRNYVELVNDDRIKFIETEKHRGNWGHSYRSEYIQKADGDYILITNADNQHVPVYLEYMLKGFGDGVIATYCSVMVHSYRAWQVIPCMLKRGFIDCAGVVVKASAAKEVGWRNVTDHSSDWIYFQDLISKFGAKSFIKIRGCLLIHN